VSSASAVVASNRRVEAGHERTKRLDAVHHGVLGIGSAFTRMRSRNETRWGDV